MAMPRTFAYQQHVMHACIFSLRWQVKCLLMVTVIVLGVTVKQAYASPTNCVPMNAVTPIQNITNIPGTNNVNGPIAAGSQIGNILGTVDLSIVFDGCPSNSAARQWIVPVKASTNLTFQGGAVYPTGVDGIGYTLVSRDYRASAWRSLGADATPLDPGPYSYTLYDYTLGFRNQIIFVATSALGRGTYVIPRQQVGWNRATNSSQGSTSTPQANSAIWINGFTVTVNAPDPTCSLSTDNATFDMGTLSTAAFTGGPGTHLPSPSGGWVADQSLISAGCNASTVAMTFAGTAAAAPYNKAFANAGSARGVALELWQKNGTQVTPNSSTPINFSPQGAGGRYTFSARYLQTEPTVTAGTVNARVTVTVNYK